jgi:phosphatidylglycerol---prolipoprotein diacylglyceryl transferase
MQPILFKIGPIPIHGYGLMIALGFLAALYLMQREARKAGYDPEIIGNAAFWSLLIGIAGTRVLHIIMFPQMYSWTDPVGWFAIWRGGLVFQGGPPPVVLFLIWYLRKHNMPFTRVSDIAIPFVALGHGIGRLGCFLNGCCYGKRTDSFLGLSFRRIPFDANSAPVGSPPFVEQYLAGDNLPLDALWSHPIHPTQLYSAAGLVLLCVILLVIRRKWHPFDGIMLPAYLVLYGCFRFVLEFYRGDHNPVHIGGLSDQQLLSLLSVGAGIALYFAMRQWWQGRRAASATAS